MKKMFKFGLPEDGIETLIIAETKEEAFEYYKECGGYEEDLKEGMDSSYGFESEEEFLEDFISELPGDKKIALVDAHVSAFGKGRVEKTVDEWLKSEYGQPGIFGSSDY